MHRMSMINAKFYFTIIIIIIIIIIINEILRNKNIEHRNK